MASKDRDRWRLRVGGKSVTFPKGTPKKLVDDYERKLRLRLIGIVDPEECPTLAVYSERFLRIYPTIKRRSPATLKKDKSSLDHHLIPAFGDKMLREITAPDILDFQAALYQDGEGMAAQSCSNILSTLSSIYRMAALERKAEYNPCAAVPRIPREARMPTFWTPEEADRFLIHCQAVDWELFQLCAFALNTGMRPGELQALKRDCLVFDQGFVDIRRNYCTKTNKINEHTKTRANRKIALPPAVWQVMANKRRLGMDEVVFPLVFNSIGFRRIQPMAKEAGVKPIRFHDLRHTFASHLVLHGRHPVEIKELLGHKKLSSTDIYMHLVDDLKRGVTDCLVKGMTWARSTDAKVVNIDSARV